MNRQHTIIICICQNCTDAAKCKNKKKKRKTKNREKKCKEKYLQNRLFIFTMAFPLMLFTYYIFLFVYYYFFAGFILFDLAVFFTFYLCILAVEDSSIEPGRQLYLNFIFLKIFFHKVRWQLRTCILFYIVYDQKYKFRTFHLALFIYLYNF